MFLPTARDVWEAVQDIYSNQENYSQMFELNAKMWKSQQGDREVIVYYNEMMTLCQELDLIEEEEWESPRQCSIQEKN